MSASAGRVLIIPRGTYNAGTTYQMLDLVRFGKGTFICKKTSLGNEPSFEGDTEYWQLLVISGDVSGVKGDAETEYREGNVNITYDNLGGVDSELSSVSELPVQNKVVKAGLDAKQDDIGIDEEPVAYSEKLVYSGGVKKAIDNINTSFVSYDSMNTTEYTNAGMTTGSRNLLPNNLTNETIDGIAFTKSISGSVTMSGTATNDGYKTIGSMTLAVGTYIVTQAENDGDDPDNLLGDVYVFDSSDNVIAYTSESENSFSLLEPGVVTAKIKYTNGEVYSDVVIYPMIRIGYESNDNYEPYVTLMPTFSSGESNKTLFSRISALFSNVRKLWNTVGFETSGVSKIVGDTSVTFTNSAIKTTSELELLCENSTNTPIFYTGVTVTNGSATYTFNALTVATTFYLKVR